MLEVRVEEGADHTIVLLQSLTLVFVKNNSVATAKQSFTVREGIML